MANPFSNLIGGLNAARRAYIEHRKNELREQGEGTPTHPEYTINEPIIALIERLEELGDENDKNISALQAYCKRHPGSEQCRKFDL